MKSVLTIIATTALAFAWVAPSQADTLPSTGHLPNGFHFTAAESPYSVPTTLLVDDGTTVVIDPGAVIYAPANNPLFWLHGKLQVNGTNENPSLVIGRGGSTLAKLDNAGRGTTLSIDHGVLRGISLLSGHTQDSEQLQVRLTNSDFISTTVDAWYPGEFTLLGNTFSNGGGVNLGYGVTVNAANNPANISNNLFLGDGTIGGTSVGLWISDWAAYGKPIQVHSNSFINLSRPALKASLDSGEINASSNYWGTTDASSIQSYVLDKNDSFDYLKVIDVSAPLQTPDITTPRQLSPSALKQQVFAIAISASNLYLVTQMRGTLTASLRNQNGEGLAGATVTVVSPPSAKCIPANQISDQYGNVTIWCDALTNGSGQISITAGQATQIATINVSNRFAELQITGKTLTLKYGYAAGQGIVISDGAKRLAAIFAATNEPGSQSFKLTKGKHAIKVTIGGVQVAYKTITVSK